VRYLLYVYSPVIFAIRYVAVLFASFSETKELVSIKTYQRSV